MTTSSLHPLAGQYLERLERAAARVPRARRAELLAEIEAHLADAIPPDASDADALNVLERLGAPEEIVDAEAPSPAAAAAVPARGTREWAAIFLLLFGGVFAGIGWVVGLIFLWGSNAWTAREKWIGTLVVPGGLGLTTLFYAWWVLGSTDTVCVSSPGLPEQCTGDGAGAGIASIAILLVLLLAPFVTAIFLARRAGRRATTA